MKTQTKEEKIKHKCMFLKNKKCNSDYARGLKCDGLTPPDKCPYDKKLGELEK